MGDRKWTFSYIAWIRVMLNESMLKMGDKSIVFSYIAWIYVKVNEFAPKMGDKPAILSHHMDLNVRELSFQRGSSVFRKRAQFSERELHFPGTLSQAHAVDLDLALELDHRAHRAVDLLEAHEIGTVSSDF